MGPRPFLILCCAALAAAALLAVAAGVWLIYVNLPDHGSEIAAIVLVYGGGIAFLLVGFVALLWGYLDQALARPIAIITRGIQQVVHANPDHRIVIDDIHHLGALPAAVNDLVCRLASARRDTAAAIARATVDLEAQKTQLGTVLRDLHEGVIVCNLNHRILLYNYRAQQLLRIGGEIGLDRSLFDVLAREPILHAFRRLTTRLAQGRYESQGDGSWVSFLGAPVDGGASLEGRLSLVLSGEAAPTGYVISFEDRTDALAALAVRDRLLRAATVDLRRPVANLHAAVEILCGSQPLDGKERSQFQQVALKESRSICKSLDVISSEYKDLITGYWPISDIHSSNLFYNLARRLREQHGFALAVTGMPRWLRGDSYSLILLLDRLIVHIAAAVGISAADIEALAGDRHVYIDVIWQGPAVAASRLHGWLDAPLEATFGEMTLRDVLDRHQTDVWSLTGADGFARLRLPLPGAVRPAADGEPSPLPARPEFYDFALLKQPVALGDLGRRSLRSLNYVVFDCETTGLAPSAGDEIVAIAGVRIVNGRILTGEQFERLVDPRRPIPASSTRFHGITAEMVRNKPPLTVVLPQFRAFVGDAVLVAHNAAFDLKFLKLKEAECGVRFDMPVLDTLLLSVFLHDHTDQHSLDAVAQRFGVPIERRHTAPGDALATAGIFVKMLDVLVARGVGTLNEAMAAGKSVVDVRTRQAVF